MKTKIVLHFIIKQNFIIFHKSWQKKFYLQNLNYVSYHLITIYSGTLSNLHNIALILNFIVGMHTPSLSSLRQDLQIIAKETLHDGDLCDSVF